MGRQLVPPKTAGSAAQGHGDSLMRKLTKRLALNKETLRQVGGGEATTTGFSACKSESVCATLCTVCVSCHGGSTCL
jgi:hypothetical protein